MYERLTKHCPKLQEGSFGQWVIDTQNDMTARPPRQMPRELWFNEGRGTIHGRS